MGYQAKVKRARRWLRTSCYGGANDKPPERDAAVLLRVEQKAHPRKPQKVRAPASPLDSSRRGGRMWAAREEGSQ